MEPYEAYEILKNKTYKDDEEQHLLLDKIFPNLDDCQECCLYAKDIIEGRWPEADDILKKYPWYAYLYAAHVIKGRWPEAEPYIKNDPASACYYAKDVIKGRWPEVEDIIKTNTWECFGYAIHVIKGRWPEVEDIIKTNSLAACEYAKFVIKGRWLELEEYIKNEVGPDSGYASWYATFVINDENFWEKREKELFLNDPLKVINEIHQSRVKELERKIEQERERERQRIEQELERERQEVARLQNIADKHQRLKDWLQKIESVINEHNIDVSSLIPNQDQDFDEIEIKENITKYVGENIPVMVTTTDTNYTTVA